MARTQQRAGKYLGAECREQVSAIRSELQGDILAAGTRARELVEVVHGVNTRAVLIRFISVGVLCGLLLFGTGIWVGAYCLRVANRLGAKGISAKLMRTNELSLSLRDAATYSGISPQTVYQLGSGTDSMTSR